MGEVRRIIEGALREVEGVLPDKPVDVLYMNFGEFARVVRVRWWIESMHHDKRVLDRVNIAIQRALDEAEIEIRSTIYYLNFRTTDLETASGRGVHKRKR